MATYEQRAQAIADAILNSVATPTQVDRIGAALSRLDGDYDAYASATSSIKAQMIVTKSRSYFINVIKATDGQVAVTSALASASSSVETEFQEAP